MIHETFSDAHRSGAVEAVMQHHKRVGPLTADQEYELIPAAKRGDRQALDRLVYGNAPYVYRTAAAFRGRGVAFEDLFFSGMDGLAFAVTKVDVDRLRPRRRLTSYAHHWIRQRIRRTLVVEGGNVRLPFNSNHVPSKIAKAKFWLLSCGVLHPSLEQIAETAGVSLEDAFVYGDVMVTCEVREDDATVDADTILSPVEERSRSRWLHRMCNEVLDERERRVIERYWLVEETTLWSVGKEMGLSGESVRLLSKRALRKLRAVAVKRYPLDTETESMYL